jgi:hypothetical protein
LIGHLSADELASYRAGAVRAGRASRISAHLTSCSRCAGVDSQLAGVSRLLASVAAPPIPDRLTQRLRTTLAAESAQRAAATGSPLTSSPLTSSAGAERASAGPSGRPASGRAWRPRVPDWSSAMLVRSLAVTGVLALIVAGGLVLANLGPSSAPSLSARPASGPAPRPAAQPAGPERSTALPGGDNVGAAATLPVRYQYQGGSVITNVVVSNFDYTKSDLATGIRASISSPLTIPVSGTEKQSSPSATSANQAHGISADRLAGCLSKVAAGHRILLAEVVRYLAGPATIVVLKPIGHIFNVIVVGAACSATKTDVLTRLSLQKS